MTRAYLAFTAKGLALAEKLAAEYPGSVARCGHEPGQPGLADWTARQFAHSDALIFVGAVGIAVRAIAPHCQSKASDPAVVVLDECGRFAVPILSGHLGGANDLARALAAVCGAVPVITTATDANGVFAVDEWAKRQNCAVLEPERIKKVSGALLAGRTVQFASGWPIAGTPPAGLAEDAAAPELALTLCPAGDALHLVPRIGVLGVGCKRGTGADTLAEAFAAFCAENRLAPQCITAAASIDLKQNEAGLLAGGVFLRRNAARCARQLYALGLCAKHHRRGQCLRACGGAGSWRGAGFPQICPHRRDFCAGGAALCPGLEVAA